MHQQNRQVVQQQSSSTQQSSSVTSSSQQQFSRVEQHHVTRQVTSQQQRVQGSMVYQSAPVPVQAARPGGASPPVFEQIFRNARFAQDGNATFDGRVRGNPTPQVSWTKQGVPIHESQKYHMRYDEVSGDVSLVIVQIGPGDEGEYTCSANNQYGEAICSIRIQPEGQGQQQLRTLHQQQQQQQQSSSVIQGGYRKEYAQTFETSQQISGSQVQSSFQKSSTLGRTVSYTNGTNGTTSEEDFKVDTFEYRLLREVEFRESITRRVAGEADAEIPVQPTAGPIAPPQIAQKARNSKLLEGSDATFSTKITGNPSPRLSWFKNGKRIQLSQKYQSTYTNQTATLNVKQAQAEDSGHYTLLAENPQGCVVSSAYLAIEPVGMHDDQQLKSFMEGTRTVQHQEVISESQEGKSLAPNFLRVCNDREATEGKMSRFDCRVTGRPYPEVTWYLNGRQICDDATHKILVNESGNHALMITNVNRNDSGTITCVARNKAGETSFECQLHVVEKELVVAPKFVERFTTVNVKQGEPVTLTARAVGTPIPRITWQKDGVPISPGPDVIISTEGGASQLDISAARLNDAAWYQCTAQNVAGSTATRARLFVEGPKGSTPEPRRLNLPRPTKVIEPELQPGPEVIYLRHVERAKPHLAAPEPDRAYPPPQFVVPLQDISQHEGGRIKLEARVEPVGDPTMVVEWFINGRPLAASSRATTTFRFGYISLELLSIIYEDSGEYLCRVTSASGVAQSQALLSVTARASIEQQSQYPDSLQYIQQLEDYSRYQRTESVDESSAQRPTFIRPLQDLGDLQEGRNAHFEAQLTPVSDPTMRLEWFKDGRAITASSRITTIFNFGYVSLNIMHLRAEDAGTYTVRAYNALGEAISNSTIKVISRSSVTGELGIPEQQRYIEKIGELEAYQHSQYAKYAEEALEVVPPPTFKTPIKDQKGIREGGFAHFEARLEPVGDSTMRVEWYKDGRPLEASNRITSFCNFGYVALTIKFVTVHDVGVYTCRAVNASGQAETSSQLSVITKNDVIFDSQHQQSLEKIQYLEDSSRYGRQEQEEVKVTQKPRFLGPLKGTNKIVEGQRAHFEVRVEPQNDMTMQIEWYHNGTVIMSASRVQTYHDFGYVALDIVAVRAEDSGTYTVVARNALGEEQISATMQVESRSSIDTSSMHRTTMEKTRHMEDSKFVEPQYYIEEISKSKPIFVQPLSDPAPLSEGKNVHLECRLEPMGDPTMRVEWYFNGRAITVGSRFKTYYDFGYVALDILHCTTFDSGEYTVRAVNHLGSAHTSACVRVLSRDGVDSETMNEAALQQIYQLEDYRMTQGSRTTGEDISVMTAPQFTKPLHNVDIIEGTNVHLECRLQPVNDSSMRVEWFCNGRPIRVGHRFRPAHDFDYVALDLLSVYPEDSGVYSCQAYNNLGEAVTSCSVKVIAKRDLILDSQHQSGLEKIQYLEDSSRYRKQEMTEEVVNIKPRFVTKPKTFDNMREGQHCHFECKLEPVTDPNLKVEWYKNGRPITVGHRFRPIHDFGYVALDIIDLIAEDSGIYTCRAVNLVGADETNCNLGVKGTAQILTSSQNQANLEQLQYLEDRSRSNRSEFVEESTKQAPVFTSSINNITIKEGQRAHFECRLIPVSDPTMKVEWFHNNIPVKAGSRFTETNAFGFVALDIMYAYPEDSGAYTCRAINAMGQAMTSAALGVQSKKSIYLETQHESAMTKINYLEGSGRPAPTPAPEDAVVQAPVFTQPMRDLRVAENQAAHFEARIIPVGDPKMRIEWLRNGVAIQASNRVTTMHDFGYVALNMKYVYPEDSGTYTCRAVNDLGEAVTSSQLICQSKESLMMESVDRQQFLDDSSRITRREDEETIVTQPPKFVTKLNGPSQLNEGQSAHFECRIEPYPDPNMKVEWFHNGRPLQSGHRFRTTYDFGFAALDILTVYAEDAGEYMCKATNRLGQATSAIKITVRTKDSISYETQHEGALQKIQYLEGDRRAPREDKEEVNLEKPQFGRPLRNLERAEGQSAHLEATLTPVNDPTMRVEWYCNGRPIPQGHRFKTTYDFGFVALDILYAYAEDSGTYMCKARNAVGEAVTTCSIKVQAEKGLCLDTLDEERLKKIRNLEAYERPHKEEVDAPAQKPVFITPLNNLENVKEGEHSHLECRVEPINDPNLRIEWFVNGIAIRTGHRFRTTHDFGYVALDILYTYPEDSGVYMCKATNLQGEAVNTCNINAHARRSIYLDSQHPEGLAKIQELEKQGHQGRLEVEEPPAEPPRFTTELHGTTELVEGQNAHFEGRVEPVHDPNLRIEFYHNGKPLPSGSRFHITFDFGYVALDINHMYPEDAGEYVVKAINNLGQCTSSIRINVSGQGNIISESARPEGLEKIRLLEGHQPYQRPEHEELKTAQRPVFTSPLQNIDSIGEGLTAHFECRLIPVNDPTMKVEWFRNEKPIETSSRIQRTHDFGFVALDMNHVRDDDEGVYMCRATNALGEAVTTASMRIKSKASIQLETQHPEGMRKIQALETGPQQRPEEADKVFEKPIFTQVLTGPSEIWEGQNAHFECRVVPVGDPNLRFEWYVNGVELKMGSRFHVTHDFGYVNLDISKCVLEDSGVYMCKAINLAGEAVSSTSMKVKSRANIILEPIQPDAWQKIQLAEAERNKVPEMFVDTTPQQAPVFTTHLTSYDKLVENQHVRLEAQVEPRADPNLRVEWFKNGKSLTTGARLRSTFDFGLVTLDINGLRGDDSAIYTCKATNLLGEAVSTCTLKIEDKHWLLGGSLRPEALPIIEALETPQDFKKESAEPVFESPVFISHLNNVELKEGETAHFECNVEPSKDPTMQIEWFVNGKPLPTGARYKSTYDFGYVALDVTGCYPEDAGLYTCKATNNKGSAVTTGTLKCAGDRSIYLDTQHPQGLAGLEKVQETEEALAARGRGKDAGPEPEFPKPWFTVPLKPEFHLGENDVLHLECNVEPKEDPNLKLEWYFNGKALEHGARFKMANDFGFVTLDLSDVYERDQGIYTCKAYNRQGEAFTSTTIYCSAKEGLIEKTQHPKGKEGLEAIQDLEDALSRPDGKAPESEEGRAPEFTSQFQNLSNLSEGDIAHFEASLIPLGDQSMVVEWFYKGEVLKASHRVRTVYAFGMVVLEILGTKIEDSGEYTCRATNKWGKAEINVQLECVDKSSGRKPQFTTQIQNLEGLKDGDSAHFECTLIPVGDPAMKVEWFHNGQPMRHSSRIKTVSDFGYVVMDIAYVQSHDSGEYICKATNKFGSDTTKAFIKCAGKGGVYYDSLQPDSLARIRELESQGQGAATPTSPSTGEPPKFTTHITNVEKLKEGQSAHFEARLTPIADPDLKVEWYYNGKKLPHGHRYRTFHDFGIVILDILYCYEENSGEYECRAVNKYGNDQTKATLKCSSKANLILDSQLPQGMEGGLEKIQNLEDAMVRTKDERSSETGGRAPVFTVPLSNIDSLREGESSHFEARLTPTDDPKLKVEWFWNGKPLKTGSRFRTFCDFGFVILEISPVYPEDSGEYSCRAFNDYGEAVTTATMKVQGKRSIIFESQLPKGMERTIEKIAELEGLGATPDAPAEEDTGKPPEFVTTPTDLTLQENSLAHFECRLIPANDPSMRVEWFHNGKALWAGSRIKTINDFGFVILEMSGVYQRDSGLYTCKATNRHGEATVSCKLQVRGRQGIVLEPQLPNNFRTGTESLQKLEENLYKRDEIAPDEEKPDPPRFTVELKDCLNVNEGSASHFDCRVEPVGDSTMRIDWFLNGRPFPSGSRMHTINDFGYVTLDLDWTYPRDSGEILCRATNRWGSATTKASLTCKGKRGIIMDTQLPEGMVGEKLKELEKGNLSTPIKEDEPAQPPKFITQIESLSVTEGEPLHFECRVEPKTDPRLKVQWYHNGKLLSSGHRFRSQYDFGFVSLDILYSFPEDQGDYECVATNEMGKDVTKARVSCKSLPNILLHNQVPKGMKKNEALMQMEATIKKYTSEVFLTEDDLYDVDKKQPPRFVTQIQEQLSLVEMQSTKFECQLAPVGDPHMKVEWFFNGKPLPHKTRFNPIYDFGYVAMNFGWVYPEDSGEYLCRATNLYGMDETRAFIKTAGKPGIIYESQLPKGMKSIERIREMEAAWQMVPDEPDEDEKPKQPPMFVLKPEPCIVEEGRIARFSCRVTGHPKPRVLWLVNGHTVLNGTRYKLTFDGMWHLDIPKVRQYDNGTVEVIARNSAGEAHTNVQLTVTSRNDDFRSVLKNSPRQYVMTKSYRKPEWVTRMEELQQQLRASQVAPTFTQEISDIKTKEGEKVVFEVVYTGNPAPDVVWLHNDKLIRSTKNIKIIMKKNFTSCTINEVTRDDEGTYICKATSEVGENITKATLLCHDLTDSEKKALEKHRMREEKKKKIEADKKRAKEQAKENAKKAAQQVIEQAEIDRKRKQEERKQMEIKKKEDRILAEKRREEERNAAQNLKLKKTPTAPKKAPVENVTEDEFVKTKHILKKTEIAERKLESAQQLSWNLKKREVTATETTSKELASANLTEVQVKEMTIQEKKKTRGRTFETQEGASLSITQHLDAEESQIVMTECHEGDKMFAICSYVAENQDALNLVEGERVYILECHNSDWWFVKKHLTEEKGWAPAQMLKTEVKYSDYVQKKLHEKIDKLPVFEKPSPGEHVSAPRFTEKLQPKNSPDGGTVTFECRVEGSPRPLITWFRQTAIIKPSPDFQIFYDENNVATLLIKEVFPEDAGMFTCVAKNAAGFASSTTELVVEAPLSDHGSELAPGHSRKSLSRESSLADILEGIPPTFAQKPRTRTVDEGQSVVLECRLVAVPEPELQWFFNGKALRESREVVISMDSDMHSYNTIVKITGVKKLHEGTYEVVARNREGHATNQVVVKVITGAKEAPQILEPLKSLVVTEGDSVILSTQILANPKPKVTWYRNGVELKPDGDNSVTKLDKDVYSLTIYHTSREDDGDYMVSAENEVGSAQTSAILCVEELLELKPEPPMFVERFEEQRVQSKGIIRLEAKVTGNPQPEIAWFRNNKRLKPSKNIREIYDGESILLEIGCGEDGMEDGDYKCVATNSVGKASHGARVTVEADKIKFTKKLHNVEVEEGNVAKFECHTSQAINVKWYFNNLEISTTDKSKYEIITEAKKHILIIKKVEEHDAGQVKCTAKDQSTQATLIIRESGVEFVRKLVDFEVKEREMAILEVEVSSNNAEVSWHKDGEELKFGDDRFEFEKEGTVRKLLIRCTSVHDEGEYTCALGEQECTAEVTVVELPPEIISRMHDVTIAKGERATFEIELTKGDALVRWFKDGAELQFSEHVQLAIDGKRQRLMVYNSVADDEGEYSCQVGEQTSVAYLKVEEPAVQFITRLPDVTLTPLKSDAVFTVELSLPDIEVVWLRNGKPIKASDRYEMSAEGGIRRLVIKKVTMEDQSEYSCLAINVRTNTKLKVEIIETVPRINMDLTKKDYRVRKGEDVEITVKYSGIPKPKDEWFVNGKLIRPSKKISTSIDDSSATLTIKKVQEEDCGDLTLKLTNNCGEASAELTLIIMQSPSQPGTPEVIEVTNESVTLHWRAPEHDGNTKITNYILEYHDKVDVLSWTKVTESISETTHKVTKLQQNMEYMFRVTAQNEVGPSPPSGTSRYIRITQPGTSEPPVIQQPLSDVISGLGVPATLQCVIGGVPEPEIKWLRDGKVFKTKTMTYENRIAKFTVNQVSETSGATFTCQATNQAGVAETSAKLIVQEKPRLETDETLLSQKLRVSSQWKIEVKFSGFPKPEISWSRDGRRLESNKKCSVYVDETSTTIAIYTLTREDSGVYKVTATNSAGSTTLDLNLRVIDDTERLNKSRSPSEEPIDKPGRPEGPLVVKKIQKESVTIEWKPPADDGGLDISKYSVEKCDVTKMQWMKVADIEGAITSYAIQRLNEGSEYMFRVFAANPIGYSEALESDTVVVKSQHEPPSPPRGPLDLTGMTDTSLTIKWQAPESDGGCAILEYLVERREVSKKAWQKVGSTESQHIEVTSLKLNTSYHFRITAINEVGQSSPFAPEEAITVGKRITPPSKPTNLTVVDVTSRSVTLEWGPPASTGGTEITGYIIEKRITTSKTYEKVVTLEPSVSQYCILNLKEKSEFYFRVYAENAMGLSEPAETQRVRLKTHASPPSPPTAPLETRGTGPNSIVIAWGIPESDGGAPIEGYTIAIKDTRKTMWMEVGRVKADVQKLNIRDLQEGHTYMLRIFARNEVGQSEALESEEPVVVLRPADSDLLDVASRDGDKDHDAPSISLTTETTTSWMKESNMDADISTYARGCLLRNDEYFFKIWHNARKLFK